MSKRAESNDGQPPDGERRKFLHASGVLGVGALISAAALPGCKPSDENAQTEKDGSKEEVTPAEDLMREHGVLKRVILVYRHYIERIDGGGELPPDPLAKSAGIIRTFVEDYHEKLEETQLFPRFRKANQLVDLVDILLAQHQAGRRLTDQLLGLATAEGLREKGNQEKIRSYLSQFVRMYEPHEAREDTVLFPAFAKIVSRNEYDSLGEQFEDEEQRLFGEDGFEKMVDQVASIEKSLGIYDLGQFTPKVG
jgi:hemerythrin-like domain-containing protein